MVEIETVSIVEVMGGVGVYFTPLKLTTALPANIVPLTVSETDGFPAAALAGERPPLAIVGVFPAIAGVMEWE
jgi:hypothetical protein